MGDIRFAFGKRRDGKGYDVMVIRDGVFELHGPYRLQREARAAITSGELLKATPREAEQPHDR